MTFKDHIDNQKKSVTEFRNTICVILGNMPVSTFYHKVRYNSFTLPEKALIANLLNEPIADLFPEYVTEEK